MTADAMCHLTSFNTILLTSGQIARKANSPAYGGGCCSSVSCRCPGCYNAHACTSGGSIGIEYDGLSVGAYFALWGIGVVFLILAIVFSCGMCPCACFATEAKHANPDQHQHMTTTVITAVPVAQPSMGNNNLAKNEVVNLDGAQA